MKQRKGPEKDAAQKLREDYEKIVKRPVSSIARKEIEELLKNQKKSDGGRPKRIAKSRQDVEL